MNKTHIPSYNNKLDTYKYKLDRAKNNHSIISWIRLLVFVVMAVSWFYVVTINITFGVLLGSACIVVFALLLKRHSRLDNKIEYLKALVNINKKEVECCRGNYSGFCAGDKFIDHTHPYTYDIDIFGTGSLFQYLNRTVTQTGEQKLSHWLSSVPLPSREIIRNQQAIRELVPLLDFRQGFQAVGNMYKTEAEEVEAVNRWLNHPLFFRNKRRAKLLLLGLPAINILVIFLVGINIFPLIGILWVILVNLALVGIKLKKFNAYYQIIANSHAILKKLTNLIEHIESRVFKNDKLVELKTDLYKNNQIASSQIRRLTKITDALDNRNNILLGVVLNSFLMWDWNCLFRIEQWQQSHKLDFSHWMGAIAHFDALISLSNLAYNNPDFNYPAISEPKFKFEATEMGHPLLPADVRVCNNFLVDNKQRFAIITGANMAGKSTFLRTVAVNLVLAGCGAPVCAKSITFTPMPLFSSMRAEDSLMKNESYFFAELKRLQNITRELEAGNRLFIVLDEILRGTNSEDKRKGSIGFIKKITAKMAHGLVATHDLELARLAGQQPRVFKALCFEVAIKNNELQFDYKLQPGVTQNMNASFLMAQMGIID